MLMRGDGLVHLLTKDTENGITSKRKRVDIRETISTNKELRELMELLRGLKIL